MEWNLFGVLFCSAFTSPNQICGAAVKAEEAHRCSKELPNSVQASLLTRLSKIDPLAPPASPASQSLVIHVARNVSMRIVELISFHWY